MGKILEKLELKINKIVEKIISRYGRKLDEIILTKINDKGLLIAYWVSSVLSKVFLIYLLMGFILNLYIYGINIYYNIINTMVAYNWLSSVVLDLIIPMLVLPLPYIFIRLFTKLLQEKLNVVTDQSSLLFATGLFLILDNIIGVTRVITSVSILINQVQLVNKINAMMFAAPLINLIIPIIYITIGFMYVKRSKYLTEKIVE